MALYKNDQQQQICQCQRGWGLPHFTNTSEVSERMGPPALHMYRRVVPHPPTRLRVWNRVWVDQSVDNDDN